jgi:TPR repeat protein
MYYFGNTSLALDVSEAFAWYTQAAEAGSAVAQQQLGLMYKRGEGVTKDYHEAYYWLKQAANQNEGSAIYELAKLYEEGKGVPQNFKKAYEWFEKSAYLGNPAAQLQLAQIFLKEDTLKNRKLAYVWSSIAATNGSNSAINFRDSIELEPKMKREAQAQAEDLYKKIKEEQKLALKIQ